MTGRTHDLAAFTALTVYIAFQSTPQMTIATAVTAFGANMIGGLLPDIDDETSDVWDKIRGGSIISRIIHPLLGHHRMISHSILGMLTIGFLINFVLISIQKIIIVDINVIFWSIMIGYFSHLIMDSFTIEGVPWFFPIPIRLGIPPFKFLRVKTGGIAEKFLVFPGLIILNGYLIYAYYPHFQNFIKNMIR
jgi:inner membrane protein